MNQNIISLILALLIPAFSVSQPLAGWKTIELPDFQMNYPSNWEADQSGQMGTSLVIFSPVENEKDAFRENVNVLIQDLKGNKLDLETYAKLSEQQVKKLITNSEILESKGMNNGKNEFHKILFNGDQGELILKFEQYYFIANEKAYVITFTSERKNFATYQETGEKILNSFSLK